MPWAGLVCVLLAHNAAGAPVLLRDIPVASIASGDRFRVHIGQRRVEIHLAGVTAPALDEPYAAAAKRALGERLFGQRVTLHLLARPDEDHAEAEVRLGDLDINADMVRGGLVRVDRRAGTYPGLERVESEARLNRRGLWAGMR